MKGNRPLPNSTPLTIVAITTAEPGRADALREAQAKLVAETLHEPGCLRYELHQSLDDGRILIFVETWADEASWHAHMQGEAIKNFQASGAHDFIDDFALYRMAQVAGGKE